MDHVLATDSFVARPRVEALIREAIHAAPITIVHAPLGSGKSVALAASLAGRDDVAYFEAHPWHRAHFVEALVMTVRVVRSDFGQRTLGALEAGAGARILGQLFSADLQHVTGSLVIAIDNTEHVADDEDFATFVDAALAALPSDVRIVFAGRTLPPIAVNTALVRRQAVVVGPDVLAFTRDEIQRLAERLEPSAGNDRIAHIERESDGWATGIALALQSHGVSSGISGTDLARAFLAEALLPRLPPATVTFLEETSVYEVLDSQLLRSSGEADPETEIAALERAGAPIVRAGPFIYRVHAILRSLALERLASRAGVERAHARAAVAFSTNGDLSAALFHARASRDEAVIDRLLRTHADSLVRTADPGALRDALRLLSRDESKDVRTYVDALLAKNAGDERAAALFERASAAADNIGDAHISFAARAQAVERAIGRLIPVEEHQLADLETRAKSLNSAARAQTAMYRGWQRAVAHDFQGALEAIDPLLGISDVTARFNTGVLSAYAHVAQGAFDRGLSEIDALVRLLEDDGRVVLQTLALIWLARLALLAGRTTLGSDAGRAALQLVETLSIRAEEAALYAALAELATHEGDVQQAIRFAERASATADRAWYAGDVERTRAFAGVALARAAFLGHDNAVACDLALRTGRSAANSVQRTVALAEAVIYSSLVDASSAASVIDEASAALCDAMPVDAADAIALATAADILSFVAAADSLAFEREPAPASPFAHAIERRRGLVTLEHAGIALANLRRGKGTNVPFDVALERIAAEGPRFEVRLARAYAARFTRVTADAPASAPGFELTPRESEILELLVGGLSNKEIAQRLVLSPRTAETHVERVLGKLAVPSRSRAIAKALRLGLVTLPAD